MRTIAVIPAYNEEQHIQEVIQETRKYVDDIIVVDDGSRDNTCQIAQNEKVTVLKLLINLGKGSALRTGCDLALKKGAENIVVLDSDGQHDPKHIPEMLEALEEAEVVFGYRKLSEHMPFILRFGNWFINKTTQALYNISLNDTQCGYRAFTAEAYPKLRWDSSDYSMESEMIAKVGKRKLKHKQLPIQTIYLDKYKGTTVLDGIKIVVKMVSWRWS